MAKAELYPRRKLTDDAGNIREIVIWKVEPSAHTPCATGSFSCVLAIGALGSLYDNHPPKGHHRHIAGTQSAYPFETIAKLLRDFEASIKYLEEH